MTTRRDVLRSMGLGAAALTVAGGSRAAHAAQARKAAAALQEGAPAPWWLVSPIRTGSTIGKGWSVTGLSPVQQGAAVLSLQHRDGRTAAVHICALGRGGRGVASTSLFDLVVMDGRDGDAPTDEDLGRAVVNLSRRIHRNELAVEAELRQAAGMMTHGDRVARYGGARFAPEGAAD